MLHSYHNAHRIKHLAYLDENFNTLQAATLTKLQSRDTNETIHLNAKASYLNQTTFTHGKFIYHLPHK